MTSIKNWLNHKLINKNNGIIFDNHDSICFDVIQNFIESYDNQFKTKVIYYQAFPEESAVEFLNTLGEELNSKLGRPSLRTKQSLYSTIQDAELKMIIIDDCYLHPQDTLQNLIDFFAVCEVSVVLIGQQDKMTISQILNNPAIINWDRLEINYQYEIMSELR